MSCDYEVSVGVLMNEEGEYCGKSAVKHYQSTASDVTRSRCQDHLFDAQILNDGLYEVGNRKSVEAAVTWALEKDERLISAFWKDNPKVADSIRESTALRIAAARTTLLKPLEPDGPAGRT